MASTSRNTPLPTVIPDLTDRIWASAFFDGEGCVNMTRIKKSGLVKAQSSVVNTDLPILEWYRDRWGGAIYESKPGTQRQPAWQWMLTELTLAPFLEDIRPFLKIKIPQTDNVLAYLRLRSQRKKHSRMSLMEKATYEPFLEVHRSFDLTHGGQARHSTYIRRAKA